MNPSPYPPCVTRPSACSPVLPPELCDYILDHCYDDKATLCAGSLVSRSFNATCRYHIFSKNIDISNAPGARKSPRSSGKTPEEKESLVNKDHGAEEEAKTKSAINPKSSAGSFVRMVLTPSSTLAPFLQELSLVLRPATLSSWATIVRGKDVSASAWLDELLALLPATSAAATSVETKHNPFHLRTLRIFRHGVDLSPFALTALQQNFSSITTLAFFETTLQKRSLKKDIEWVCGFENLEDLLFYGHHRGERKIDATGGHGGEGMTIAEVDAGMPWGWSPPGHSFDLNDAVNIEGETTIRLPQRIRRLRLDLPGPALEAVMQWLLAHAPPSLKDKDGQERQGCVFSTGRKFPSVSALHIFRVMEDEAPMLRAYLRACKDTLEDLMLFLYQRTTTREDFDLSEHTALRTLFLASNGPKPMQVLRDILFTTGSSAVQRVLLQVPPWQLGADDDAWEALDNVLAVPNSNTVVSAVIDGRGTDDESNAVKLKSRLPLSVASLKDNLRVIKSKSEVVARYLDEVYGRMRTF